MVGEELAAVPPTAVVGLAALRRTVAEELDVVPPMVVASPGKLLTRRDP
jgi:hypothetical protein